MQIKVHEFTGEYLKCTEAYAAIETHLSEKSSSEAKNLKAAVVKDSSQSVQLSMDESEEVTDEFEGIKVLWVVKKITPRTQSFSFYLEMEEKSQGKECYAKIGKPWKRGYLHYGPLGTGKSSMIAAMANFMNYDIYDLELTNVKDNTQLRRLLIETTNGLWSAYGGERIIVFTTNYVEKLDPALIRRGRMDKHIELSYCGMEAFKVLARNYLDVDSHPLFVTIGHLLQETNITPADVAENLMPKALNDDAETCLEKLIEAIKTAKEEAKKKVRNQKISNVPRVQVNNREKRKASSSSERPIDIIVTKEGDRSRNATEGASGMEVELTAKMEEAKHRQHETKITPKNLGTSMSVGNGDMFEKTLAKIDEELGKNVTATAGILGSLSKTEDMKSASDNFEFKGGNIDGVKA
nr:aaa-atpase [Quercus suber]